MAASDGLAAGVRWIGDRRNLEESANCIATPGKLPANTTTIPQRSPKSAPAMMLSTVSGTKKRRCQNEKADECQQAPRAQAGNPGLDGFDVILDFASRDENGDDQKHSHRQIRERCT